MVKGGKKKKESDNRSILLGSGPTRKGRGTEDGGNKGQNRYSGVRRKKQNAGTEEGRKFLAQMPSWGGTGGGGGGMGPASQGERWFWVKKSTLSKNEAEKQSLSAPRKATFQQGKKKPKKRNGLKVRLNRTLPKKAHEPKKTNRTTNQGGKKGRSVSKNATRESWVTGSQKKGGTGSEIKDHNGVAKKGNKSVKGQKSTKHKPVTKGNGGVPREDSQIGRKNSQSEQTHGGNATSPTGWFKRGGTEKNEQKRVFTKRLTRTRKSRGLRERGES